MHFTCLTKGYDLRFHERFEDHVIIFEDYVFHFQHFLNSRQLNETSMYIWNAFSKVLLVNLKQFSSLKIILHLIVN